MAASYGRKNLRARVSSRFTPSKLRVPPQVLAHPEHGMPPFEGTLAIRTPDLKSIDRSATWTDAYALAYQGRIEAVCSNGGAIRYFRMLTEAERPKMTPSARVEEYESTSTAFAQTRLGVFREPVKAGFYSEDGGESGEAAK